jgi:hypothetical protein
MLASNNKEPHGESGQNVSLVWRDGLHAALTSASSPCPFWR